MKGIYVHTHSIPAGYVYTLLSRQLSNDCRGDIGATIGRLVYIIANSLRVTHLCYSRYL